MFTTSQGFDQYNQEQDFTLVLRMLPVQLRSILMVKTAWMGSLVAPLEAAELCPFLEQK